MRKLLVIAGLEEPSTSASRTISYGARSNIAKSWRRVSPSDTGVKRLVYFEEHGTALAAIQREKNIKHWPREWKVGLILSINADWRDLYDEIVR